MCGEGWGGGGIAHSWTCRTLISDGLILWGSFYEVWGKKEIKSSVDICLLLPELKLPSAELVTLDSLLLKQQRVIAS